MQAGSVGEEPLSLRMSTFRQVEPSVRLYVSPVTISRVALSAQGGVGVAAETDQSRGA